MSQAGQAPTRTTAERVRTWLSIAEGHAKHTDTSYRLYPGDWAALASTLREALAIVDAAVGDGTDRVQKQ